MPGAAYAAPSRRSQVKPGRAIGRQQKKLTLAQAFHLLRRAITIVVAVRYISVSINASVASLNVLLGTRNDPMAFEAYDTLNILDTVGKTTIADSPLVLQLLQNNTSPRPYALYLEANGGFSTTNCSTPMYNAQVYNVYFLLASVFNTMKKTYHVVPEFATHEIVLPIVDCSFTPIVRGDNTAARLFYLMRDKATQGDLVLSAARFSMQDYKSLDPIEHGPIGIVAFDMIRDMRVSKMTTYFSGTLGYPFEPIEFVSLTQPSLDDQGYWTMETIPMNPQTTAAKKVYTASRTGFYISSDSEQSNIKNLHWSINDDPISSLTKWNWKGEPVLKDSWAWVHLFHVGFALDGLFNLGILLVVVYRNFQQGKFWIGDAFVSISSTLLTRGLLILVSWVINGFWSLMEFCLHDAHALAKTQEIFIHLQIMRADLLTIYLAGASVLGYAFRERIDPAVAIIVFDIIFANRLGIIAWFPQVLKTVTDFAKADHELAILGVSPTVAAFSPMRQWTKHPLPAKDVHFVFCCLVPIFIGGAFVVLYIAARKVYAHFFHAKMVRMDNSTVTSTSDSPLAEAAYKRTLTLFEIATGAELQTRFGIVGDFDNFLVIKGLKFASADGIYSNGFVVANGKFLLSTADLSTILFLKLTGVRLRNAYAYELQGNTVQQTAHLVYADTLTWKELLQLNITVLS